MSTAFLEHVNFTVADPAKTATQLCDWFGWHVRWNGPSKDNGITYHVGSDTSYVAVYSGGTPVSSDENSYRTLGGMNHVAIVVDDLEATEKKILASGLKTHSHADYEPGRRFYFHDENGIEFEVVSYS